LFGFHGNHRECPNDVSRDRLGPVLDSEKLGFLLRLALGPGEHPAVVFLGQHLSQLNQGTDRLSARPKLIGDIVTHWHRYGGRRKTVCFAVNVQHCMHIRDEFVKSGVRAEHIDGDTPKFERDASL